jgi:23S rRNA (pseudouridine1915-N3)-methyltransferase
VKIGLYFVGKPRDRSANAMAEEYIKRSSRYAACEMREVRPDRFDPKAKVPSAFRVLLDPAGTSMDSAAFVRLIGKLEREGREVMFLVGGHDGAPESWKASASLLLSLSPMTMPHELARVVLAEQIYRALTTLRGHPYPR